LFGGVIIYENNFTVYKYRFIQAFQYPLAVFSQRFDRFSYYPNRAFSVRKNTTVAVIKNFPNAILNIARWICLFDYSMIPV